MKQHLKKDQKQGAEEKAFKKFNNLFVFSNLFILVKTTVLELIMGTLGARQQYTGNGTPHVSHPHEHKKNQKPELHTVFRIHLGDP